MQSTTPKLSHSERKEYNKLERQIVKLNSRIAEIDAALNSSDAKGYSVLAELAADADAARASLAEKEERWMALAVMA
jgi:septal ring factor EnvC (AmiA/AmiB activator)